MPRLEKSRKSAGRRNRQVGGIFESAELFTLKNPEKPGAGQILMNPQSGLRPRRGLRHLVIRTDLCHVFLSVIHLGISRVIHWLGLTFSVPRATCHTKLFPRLLRGL